MAEISRKIDVDKLISYSDDLVQLLKDEKDINDLNHCVEKTDALRSRCRSDHAVVQSSLEDRPMQAKNRSCKGRSCFRCRAITNQIKDLEEQRSTIEERRQVLKKLKQDEVKAQIIPDLNDKSKISGHIVDKEKKMVEKLEVNSEEMGDFDACNASWKMDLDYVSLTVLVEVSVDR
ncbi:hypothetical protein Ccrd_008394 [Cynara cardunculus var. scolymus]|uniref:Uncharacterized protein n=1 Tax=Cynara cardunculus var. scolymus TaxID=59895 RepID=A0A103XF43_CYNCS|nr:hypothetical protein Ccrd_008394 [Cynara cardunculus var. scolymus]